MIQARRITTADITAVPTLRLMAVISVVATLAAAEMAAAETEEDIEDDPA